MLMEKKLLRIMFYKIVFFYYFLKFMNFILFKILKLVLKKN